MNRIVRRTTAALATLGTAAALALVASPAHATEEVFSFPASGSLDVLGKGFGHGHGMSQYGAKSRGEAGQSWTTITDFYYPGTSVDTFANSNIAVALTNAGAEGLAPSQSSANRYQCDFAYPHGDKRNCGFTLPPATGLQWKYLTNGTWAALPGTVEGRPVSMWGAAIVASGSQLQLMAKTDVKGADGSWWHPFDVAQPDGFAFQNLSSAGHVVGLRFLDGTLSQYLGRIELRRTGTTRLIRTNVVPMESYLRGVVPREMPAGWDADALRAQAVAARTYAANEQAANAFPYFDSCDSTWCQVYRGELTTYPSGTVVKAETSTNNAVSGTAGKIRTYSGAPAYAQFGASNGGYMAAGAEPYLKAGWDSYDKYPSWTATLTAAKVKAAYPLIGTPLRVVITARDGGGTWGGRVTGVRFEGTNGSQTVTGDVFRSLGGFRSTYLTLVRVDPHDRIGAAASGSGSADVVSRLDNGSTVYWPWSESGGLGTSTALAGPSTGYAAGIARSSAGQLDTVVSGSDQVYINTRPAGSSTWSGWRGLGGTAIGRPAVVAQSNGYLLVFVHGTDGRVWWKVRGPSGYWAGWRLIGGGVASGTGPSAVQASDGTVYLVVHGTDARGWVDVRGTDGKWSGWIGLGGRIVGDPAIAADTAGKVTVVVRGSDDRGWVNDLAGRTPSAWIGISGHVLASPVAFAVAGSGRLDVLVNGDLGTLMRDTRTGGAWSGWVVAE